MTIQEVNNKSFQEIFDFVANHLLTQNAKAVEDSGTCRYRYCHLKCAVGALISDEDYDCNFEMQSLKILARKIEKTIFSDIEESRLAFLMHLQEIHDDYAIEEWSEKLSILGSDYDLSNKILEKFKTNEKH
jgi:hypothetical protein